MTDAYVKAMVSLAVFRLLALDTQAFEKKVALILSPATGELDERSHLPVEKAEGDPLFGMVVNTIPLEDALTLLRECGMLDALRSIEESPMPESGRWAIVVMQDKTAILGFSAELTEEDKQALAPGFNVVPLDQLASAPTDFQAWTGRQLERDIPRLVKRQPAFADENQHDTIVCCIARGSVLDELIHPEIRTLEENGVQAPEKRQAEPVVNAPGGQC